MIDTEAILRKTLAELYPSELFTLPHDESLVAVVFALAVILTAIMIYLIIQQDTLALLPFFFCAVLWVGFADMQWQNKKFLFEKRMELLMDNPRNLKTMYVLNHTLQTANMLIDLQTTMRMNPK